MIPERMYIVGIVIGVIIGYFLCSISKLPPVVYEEVKCDHLTEKEVVLKHEKYIMFQTQLTNTTNEKKKERLLDSLLKYRIN